MGDNKPSGSGPDNQNSEMKEIKMPFCGDHPELIKTVNGMGEKMGKMSEKMTSLDNNIANWKQENYDNFVKIGNTLEEMKKIEICDDEGKKVQMEKDKLLIEIYKSTIIFVDAYNIKKRLKKYKGAKGFLKLIIFKVLPTLTTIYVLVHVCKAPLQDILLKFF
jgi:hypothetical protein